MSGTLYQFVIPATDENIDVRLGSMGLPALALMDSIERIFMTMFLNEGACLCVEETHSGAIISIKHKKP